MKNRYTSALTRYLAGATAARAGDEMSGPALLLLGLAVTGSAAAAASWLAALTVAAAAGGPVFGAFLDRSARPERMLAWTLGGYGLGLAAITAAAGRAGQPAVVCLALLTGLAGPAVAGGWTSRLAGIVPAGRLARGSALDALTYSAASLAGPALASAGAAWPGPRAAMMACACLMTLAAPVAWSLRGEPATGAGTGAQQRSADARGERMPLARHLGAGFTTIAALPALRRATVTSVVSYVGVGMFIVCCPLLGKQRLGGASQGTLLLSAMAAASLGANAILARRTARGDPDKLIGLSTAVLLVAMAAAAIAPGLLAIGAAAIGGAGEGPQLTALLAVRHREAPAAVRSQVFTTAASLKIGGLAAGTALAGPLAVRSLTGCLLLAAGAELCAAVAYLGLGHSRRARRRGRRAAAGLGGC